MAGGGNVYVGKSRLRRKFRRKKKSRKGGSAHGKYGRKEPGPARVNRDGAGRQALPKCQPEPDNFSVCSAVSTNTSDQLPLILYSESMEDLNYPEFKLPPLIQENEVKFQLPFGLFKKKSFPDPYDLDLGLEFDELDRTIGMLNEVAQSMDLNMEKKLGLVKDDTQMKLKTVEEDRQSDSGVESVEGESSKEASPEPENKDNEGSVGSKKRAPLLQPLIALDGGIELSPEEEAETKESQGEQVPQQQETSEEALTVASLQAVRAPGMKIQDQLVGTGNDLFGHQVDVLQNQIEVGAYQNMTFPSKANVPKPDPRSFSFEDDPNEDDVIFSADDPDGKVEITLKKGRRKRNEGAPLIEKDDPRPGHLCCTIL